MTKQLNEVVRPIGERAVKGVSMSVEEEIMAEVNSAVEAPSETPEQPKVESEPQVEESAQEDPQKTDFYKSQYENLQKDYTRKAQELAELKKINSEPKEEAPQWTKPDYQPKTWQEVFENAKQAALKEVEPALTEYQQARQQRELYAQAQTAVDA
jgi:hypothetical protein